MSSDPANEVPWFRNPPDAVLFWSTKELGHLHFMDPQGEKTVVPVTRGDSRRSATMHVWHIDIDEGTDVATVTPSVHYAGRWHTPNPVRFKLIKLIG